MPPAAATGRPLDRYLREEVFSRIGITDVDWDRDSAGNPYVYARLSIYAEDLARLGVLMVQRGEWNGERLIAESYFDEVWRGSPQAPRLGLLWQLVPAWTTFVIDSGRLSELRTAGVDSTFVATVATIQGRYESFTALMAAFRSAFGPDWARTITTALAGKRVGLERREYGPIVGLQASGYLGQYLVVLPRERLVAVRMIAPSPRYRVETDSFEEFSDSVRALVRPREYM